MFGKFWGNCGRINIGTINRVRLNQRGFTLIEMLVVLAVISMLLGISIPFTAQFGKGLRIKTASRAILGTLRLARSNAITYRMKYTVVFDVGKNEYWIEDAEGKVFEKKRRLPTSIEFKAAADGAIDPVAFENDKVVFYSSGGIEGQSGSITITDKQGESKTISILASTGKITID